MTKNYLPSDVGDDLSKFEVVEQLDVVDGLLAEFVACLVTWDVEVVSCGGLLVCTRG